MSIDLPDELVDIAEKELNETPASRAAGLKALHDYYAEHPAERPYRDDDPFLLMFLRHAKFDVAKARARLAAMERWLRDCKDDIGDITQLHGEMFRGLYEQGFVAILAGIDRRTREGARISLIVPSKLQRLDDPTILLKWNVWVLTRAVHNPYVQVCGQVLLQTFQGCSLLNAFQSQVPRSVQKKNFRFTQEVMPFRLRGIWIIHHPTWIGALFALFKPFLSAKLRSRVKLLGHDPARLAALVDPAVLPAEFGGTHPDGGAAWFEQQLAAEARERQAAAAAAAVAAEAK